MGVKPLVSASFALAQRLVRAICQNCKQPNDPSSSELSVLGVAEDQLGSTNFMRGQDTRNVRIKVIVEEKVCSKIFAVNEEIEEMIYHSTSIVELRKKLVKWVCVRCVRMVFVRFWPVSLH